MWLFYHKNFSPSLTTILTHRETEMTRDEKWGDNPILTALKVRKNDDNLYYENKKYGKKEENLV